MHLLSCVGRLLEVAALQQHIKHDQTQSKWKGLHLSNQMVCLAELNAIAARTCVLRASSINQLVVLLCVSSPFWRNVQLHRSCSSSINS